MYQKILVAEDHALLRRMIRTLCIDEGIPKPSEVQSCRELMQELNAATYTHLILDLGLEDGSSLPLLPKIRRKFKSLKILIYSTQPTRLFGDSLWQKYRARYLSKAEVEHQNVQKLIAFINDKPFPESPLAATTSNPFADLTIHEKEVLHYLLLGWDAAKIAAKLGKEPVTVRGQKKSILEKTNARNLLELKDLALIHKV